MFLLLKHFYFRVLNCKRGSLLNSMTPTQLSNAIPTIWDKKVRLDAARKAFWGKFVGKEGSDQPIIERMDFTQEPGNQINIQIASQLLQEGVTGDTTLEDLEEQFSLGQISITPNVLRHAVAINWRAKKQINFNALEAIGDILSSWLARRTDEDLFNEIINNNPPAIMYAGNASSLLTLGVDDTFGTDEIIRGSLALQRQGALPIRTVLDGKQEIDWWGCVINECDAYQLKLDKTWTDFNQYAGPRAYDENRIFTGELGTFNNVHVYSYTSVKYGNKAGSYLRPEAIVSVQLSAAATTLTVGTEPGTGNTTGINFTKWFPATGNLIIDSEIMSYTGTTANTFTGLTRGLAGGGAAAIHNVGALVTSNNLGRAIFFGAEIAARAWGLLPTRITDVRDYGYEQGIGIMAYYGQRAIANSTGSMINAILMDTYSPNPNGNI